MTNCTVDEIIAKGLASAPNHVKVDVDGIKELILEGMQKTLRDPALRSLLCEVSTEQEEAVGKLMERFGFTCTVKGVNRTFGTRVYERY